MSIKSLSPEKNDLIDKKVLSVIKRFNTYLEKNGLGEIVLESVNVTDKASLRCCNKGEVPKLVKDPTTGIMRMSCTKCKGGL